MARLYWSLWRVTLPPQTSGAMYEGVPTVDAVCSVVRPIRRAGRLGAPALAVGAAAEAARQAVTAGDVQQGGIVGTRHGQPSSGTGTDAAPASAERARGALPYPTMVGEANRCKDEV